MNSDPSQSENPFLHLLRTILASVRSFVWNLGARLKLWSRESLPGYAEQTVVISVGAYRSGAKLLTANELTTSGVDFSAAIIALALTLLFYVTSNLYLNAWIDNSYANYRPEKFANVATLEEAKRGFVELGWLDETDANAQVATNNQTFAKPFHTWIEDMFLHSGVEEDKTLRSETVKRLVTGNRSGWVLTSCQSSTSGSLLDELQQLDGPKGHIAISIGESPTQKKLFVAMVDSLLTSTQIPIRWSLRMNGSIQFMTVGITFFALIAILRRYLLVLRLANRWLTQSANPVQSGRSADAAESELTEIALRLRSEPLEHQEEIIRVYLERIRSEVDRAVYDSYWFLASLLPSLGFIGTVVGMSAALLKADRLFTATDRQLAIGEMTRELGLAFDTTLVALLAGMLVTIPLTTVRTREFNFFREFARRMTSSRSSVVTAEEVVS